MIKEIPKVKKTKRIGTNTSGKKRRLDPLINQVD
jgi:hypothetical protein